MQHSLLDFYLQWLYFHEEKDICVIAALQVGTTESCSSLLPVVTVGGGVSDAKWCKLPPVWAFRTPYGCAWDSQPRSSLIPRFHMHSPSVTQAIQNATYVCRQFHALIHAVAYTSICILWLNWPNNFGWKMAVLMGWSCLGYSSWRPLFLRENIHLQTPRFPDRPLVDKPSSPSLLCRCLLHVHPIACGVCTQVAAYMQGFAEREVLVDPNLWKMVLCFCVVFHFCCPMVKLGLLLELWLRAIMSLVGCAQYVGELCVLRSKQPCLPNLTGRKIKSL